MAKYNHKYYASMDLTDGNKPANLQNRSINYVRKKFYSAGWSWQNFFSIFQYQ